ncbi:MAG: hypothetical protein ACLPXB_02425 [Thiobacillaceae bacterium]
MRLVPDAADAATLPMPLADLIRARLAVLWRRNEELDWTTIELAFAENGGIRIDRVPWRGGIVCGPRRIRIHGYEQPGR